MKQWRETPPLPCAPAALFWIRPAAQSALILNTLIGATLSGTVPMPRPGAFSPAVTVGPPVLKAGVFAGCSLSAGPISKFRYYSGEGARRAGGLLKHFDTRGGHSSKTEDARGSAQSPP